MDGDQGYSLGLWYNRNGYDGHGVAFLCEDLARPAHLLAVLGADLLRGHARLVLPVVDPVVDHRTEVAVRRHVDVAKRRLAHADRGTVDAYFAHRFYLHVEPGLLGTRYVECGVTVRLVTLDAGAEPALFTDVAAELPPRRGNVLYTVYGLEEHRVREPHLGDPQGANNVRPTPVISLFKRPAFVRAQAAVYCPGWGL